MKPPRRRAYVGRGAASQPANRFEAVRCEEDLEQLEAELVEADAAVRTRTELLPDRARTLIRCNDSPDIPYRYSVNPYRGCEHGCAYCYARPTHETLGYSAGLDFETKILVKYEAPELLRRELARPAWRGEPITMSGVTDPYQPVERTVRLTRRLLEVMAGADQPVAIVTKNALVLRDLDILAPMAQRGLAHVILSISTLDAELARALEPRTSTPRARLRAIAELAQAGVPTAVMAAPIIPGLTDQETPAVLAAARDAGARSASCQLLRLPGAVGAVLLEWLDRHRPGERRRVESRIRAARGGQLNDPRFGSRMTGQGPYADGIWRTVELVRRRLGLDQPLPPLDASRFRPPPAPGGQGWLF